jgi:methionyl-tRNA formyltransferase
MKVLLVAEEAAGVQALRAVTQSGHELVGVMTSGDGRHGAGAPVRDAASQMGCAAWPAEWVKDPGFARRVRDEGVDVLLNVHSLFLIHPDVLAAPRLGAYNMHPGPLPEYAGLNPVSWALYNGETTHAVTIHRMVPRIDAGPITYQTSFAIDEQDTALTVSVRCVKAGLLLVAQLLATLGSEPAALPEIPQDLSRRRYYRSAPPEGGRLNWARPGRAVVNFVRACDYLPFHSPWGHPRAQLDGRDVSIVKAVRTGDTCHAAPGTIAEVVERAALVAAADEWVLVHRVVTDGRSVDASEILAPGRRFDPIGGPTQLPTGAQLGALEQEIVRIFRDSLKIAVPTPATELIATGLLDSLGFVELLVHLEKHFGIAIAMESLEPDNFRSVASIAAFVAARRVAV